MQATSKGSDQTARMRRLVWAFASRTHHIVWNLMVWLIGLQMDLNTLGYIDISHFGISIWVPIVVVVLKYYILGIHI